MSGREAWRQKADELTESRRRGEIDDALWFDGMAAIFEAAYFAGAGPRAQSGFGGDAARWETARRPIADLVDRDGTFLDIGCANGHLIESLVRWSHHPLEPYGLELVPTLAEFARTRLPQWADRIFVGNVLTWEPPLRFDFVRTELGYVPADRERELLERLLREFVTPGGRLVVCGYGSPRSGLATEPARRKVRAHGFEAEQELAVEAPEGGGAIVELAILRA